MKNYPQRYSVSVVYGAMGGWRLHVYKHTAGDWMHAEDVIKKIDALTAHIELLEKALADKGVGMSALFGQEE